MSLLFSNVIPDDQKTETEGVEDEKSTTPDQSAPIEKPTPTGKGKGMTGEILFVFDFYLTLHLLCLKEKTRKGKEGRRRGRREVRKTDRLGAEATAISLRLPAQPHRSRKWTEVCKESTLALSTPRHPSECKHFSLLKKFHLFISLINI